MSAGKAFDDYVMETNFKVIEEALQSSTWVEGDVIRAGYPNEAALTALASLREECKRMSRELSLFKTNGDERNEWRARAEKAEVMRDIAYAAADSEHAAAKKAEAERDAALDRWSQWEDTRRLNEEAVCRAEAERDKWKVEADRRAWPKDAAQKFHRFKAERERILSIAEHLFQMIPKDVWREHGAEWMGQYEGDYLAEKIREELVGYREDTK